MKDATRKIVTDVAVFAVSQVAFYYAFKYVMASLDPNASKRLEAKKASSAKLAKLGLNPTTRPELFQTPLTEHEEQISTELILPEQITETFESIGGLDGIISSLQDSVIAPLTLPELFSGNGNGIGDDSGHSLLGAPKGVLLYGPPGTGKTMLAKALAKESGATFINMHVSTLTNKWFGESNKLVAALFSLARKLQPCIIFIDEIDSFMRERGSGDHEVTGMMKAEFMTLWDGLTSGSDRIMVLGATNRPNDIDAAILRRMPKRYAVSLPDAAQRHKILSIMLRGVKLDPSFDIRDIVRKTEGYSGSDLKELCRGAAMIPVREVLRSEKGRQRVAQAAAASRAAATSSPAGGSSTGGSSTPTNATSAEQLSKGLQTRALRNSDFFVNDSAATPMGERMRVGANIQKGSTGRNGRPVPPEDALD